MEWQRSRCLALVGATVRTIPTDIFILFLFATAPSRLETDFFSIHRAPRAHRLTATNPPAMGVAPACRNEAVAQGCSPPLLGRGLER